MLMVLPAPVSTAQKSVSKPELSAPDWDEVLPRSLFSGGNVVGVLRGGDELFPAMCEAFANARHEIWLATYIFFNDDAARAVGQALADAARRGVRVRVVVDGFGSMDCLPTLRQWLEPSGVGLAVFRPMHSWWTWLQPGQLCRLHQKMCVVDGSIGFVGGINIIDDRLDMNHGRSDDPRLDFAVQVRGPVVAPILQALRAVWTRALLGRDFREEVWALARSAEPLSRLRMILRRLRISTKNRLEIEGGELSPMLAAFALRDNLRQRRTIERSYITAIRTASRRVDIVSAYFYPGRAFRRTLRRAAERGVQVRLLLQGKLDYRFAGLAASVLYDEMLAQGIQVYEYTPAYLHAKMAMVDDEWATVGSSNIDPLSLLVNLEANVIVRDKEFNAALLQHFEQALAVSRKVEPEHILRAGFWPVLRRGFVAWCAHVYLRMAGSNDRY